MREQNALSNVFNKILLGTLVLGFAFNFSFAEDATTTPTDVSTSSAILISTSTDAVITPMQATVTEATTEEDNSNDSILTIDTSKDLDALKNFEGIVRQSTDFNCGPAALATLLTQLGYPTSEEQVTSLYSANPEKGIDLLSLKKASMEIGKSFSFQTYLKKWTLADIQEYVTRTGNPVLVHDIKKGVGGHYSVIRDIKNGTAFVSDTEAGNIEFSVEEYSHAFDGYVLIATENVNDVAVGNDVSDEEAATIWGKYVPVYMAANSVLAIGGSNGVANFKTCMAKPAIVQTTNIALRNSERAICYSNLAKDLAVGMGIIGDSKVILQVDGSKALNTSVDLEDTSLGSIVGKLKGELATLQAQLNAVSTLVSSSIPLALTNQISLLKANILTVQNSISSKQSLLNTANSNLSSIALSLGSLNQQISAKTSSIAQISANASKLPTSYDATVNSYQNQVNTANSNVSYWQGQVNNAQASVNYFYNQYYYVKNGKTSYNWSNYQAWVTNLNNANANLNAYRNQLNTAQSNLNYYKQLQTNAQNASANSQSASEQAALNSLRTQLQNKTLEQQRATDAKNTLQTDINNLNNSLNSYNSQLATANSQVTNLNTAYQNSERARINSLITSKQTEITNEQAFIDGQESTVLSAVKQDARVDGQALIYNVSTGLSLVCGASALASLSVVAAPVTGPIAAISCPASLAVSTPVAAIELFKGSSILTNEELSTFQQAMNGVQVLIPISAYGGKVIINVLKTSQGGTVVTLLSDGSTEGERLLVQAQGKLSSAVKVTKLVPSGLGSSATSQSWNSLLKSGNSYVAPRTLGEKLAMEEILANPNLGKLLPIPPLSDARWLNWSKYAYSKSFIEMGQTITVEIHYNVKLVNGIMSQIDDFKFIIK